MAPDQPSKAARAGTGLLEPSLTKEKEALTSMSVLAKKASQKPLCITAKAWGRTEALSSGLSMEARCKCHTKPKVPCTVTSTDLLCVGPTKTRLSIC